MPAYKDEKIKNKNKRWNVQFRYTDWTGEPQRMLKRGFPTKEAAKAWEREFLAKQNANLDMTFASFVERYEADMKPKLKYNTWRTKEQIIRNRILPYFKDKKMSEIKPSDVLSWQNTIMSEVDDDGNRLSKTYLKTIHNQLSAIFNHAWRFYGLHDNPARKAGNMGCEETKEMLFWTKDEYLQFADSMMDKEVSYHAFEMLYWTGIRLGELLALTPSDFDFEKNTVSITKSYQRIESQDIITTPKTPRSKRVIVMPDFLVEEMQDYLKLFYSLEPDTRIFPVGKSFLHREMARGCKETGVKRIRIHDLRHSHVSLLIDMGFSLLAIAERVGHETETITARYAHLFPTVQTEMAAKLNVERMKS